MEEGSAKISSIMEEEMKIYLKVTKMIPMEVKGCNTIGELKAKFQATEGGAATSKNLVFAGTYLKDSDILADSGVKDGSTLDMHLSYGYEMQISVEMPAGKSIPVEVKSWDTIRNVKTKIQEVEEIPADEQTLFYNGRLLEDNQTLSAYNITMKSVLYMVSDGMHIMVTMPDSRSIKFDVKTWYTIWLIKTMIMSKIRTPQEQQKLICNGKILDNEFTLADYRIQNGSIIQLLVQDQLLVKLWNGRTMTTEAYKDETVDELLHRIRKKGGKRVDHHYLMFSGKCLYGEQVLGDCNIGHESTVYLIPGQHWRIN